MTKEVKNPKDAFGNPLKVGDTVIFMRLNYRDFEKGVIKSFAPQSVLIDDGSTWKSTGGTRQRYDQVILDPTTAEQNRKLEQFFSDPQNKSLKTEFELAAGMSVEQASKNPEMQNTLKDLAGELRLTVDRKHFDTIIGKYNP